jgi:hypothetical protein
MQRRLYSYVVVSSSPSGWALLVCCDSEEQAKIWKRQFEDTTTKIASEGGQKAKIDIVAVANLCRKLT